VAIHVDPVIATSSLRLGVEPKLNLHLRRLAGGRPLVIDYYVSRHRGLTVGDLTARFPSEPLEPCYVELEPIDGIRVLAHRRLMKLLTDGATLRLAGIPLFRHVALVLPRPERWIEFLERCPALRR
jgi:hypothetical protein